MYQVGKDKIMVVHVPAAKRGQKPVYTGGDMFKGTYRRNGEGDYHCAFDEVKAMLRDQTDDTMDMKMLENMQIIWRELVPQNCFGQTVCYIQLRQVC